MKQLHFNKNKAIYGDRWWELPKLIHFLKLIYAVKRKQITISLELLESQGIDEEKAIELLPMVGGVK